CDAITLAGRECDQPPPAVTRALKMLHAALVSAFTSLQDARDYAPRVQRRVEVEKRIRVKAGPVTAQTEAYAAHDTKWSPIGDHLAARLRARAGHEATGKSSPRRLARRH